MEALWGEISTKKKKKSSPFLHIYDALYLKGISLRIQDLTDNLWCVLHDVPASS